jgi:aminoglycoside phosphotransferase (APT) family kinase protein
LVGTPALASVCARWGLTLGASLTGGGSGTWAVRRDGVPLILKFDSSPTWHYSLRVAAALRARGWPAPEPLRPPWASPDGAWMLFPRLPGAPRSADDPRARGRLLAEMHTALATCGITDLRPGFPAPASVVGDPELGRLLRVYARAHPAEGVVLLDALTAAAGWFADHPAADAPQSVIHGDFAPWNLLFEDGRLTGVLDFEASHHTFQVADFVLSWRGYQDDVIRGYDEVRPLTDLEWQLIRPVYQAWMFLGVRSALDAGGPADLSWQVAHLRKRSALVD